MADDPKVDGPADERPRIEKVVRLPNKEECDRLLNATIDGDMEVVSTLISDDVDMNAVVCEEYYMTSLHISSRYGHSKIVRKLAASGVNVNCLDRDQCIPLHYGAQSGHDKVVTILLAANAEVDRMDKRNVTPLYLASQNGHVEVVKTLLAANADVDYICNNHYTSLYAASAEGFNDVVKYLIAANADVNHVCKDQCTPLYAASAEGFSDVVKILISANADVNCVCKNQWTPLYVASIKGFNEVVKSLIEANADVNCVSQDRCTPLYAASAKGLDEVVKTLIAANANVNCFCKDHCTPLYIASVEGFNDVVKSLIAANADVNYVCKGHYTPLYAASARGFNDVVKSLIAANADVNCVCKHWYTPLHAASYKGHYDIVRTLMEANADKDLLTKDNFTAFKCAVELERSKIVKYFVEEIKVDTTLYDQPFQRRIAYLLELEAAIEQSKAETTIELVQRRKILQPQDSFMPSQSASSCVDLVTHEKVNESYMDGCLPIVDPRVVLLGCEGSGKTSLIDTLVGNSFRNTSPTEGADQMEISVTTAADWKIMNEEEKITDLKKQALLESEFFSSLKELCNSLEIPSAAQPPSTVASSALPTQHISSSVPMATPSMPTPSTSTEEQSAQRDAMAEPPQSVPQIPLNPRSLPSRLHKKFVYITKEEFQQLKSMKEKYNPRRRYVHLWDFAGQQIFHHMHGLFVSEDVVCLIVFNAGKSLFTAPDKRYPDDITPAKSAIKVICYYMEMISARVSKRSTEGDDLSEFLPTFILIGTHIDELHPDIKVATKLAFQHFVPALIKELASKPFAKHIAGSKNNQLFTEGSPSIFFISNKDELRDPVVIGKIKRVIFKAASITKQSRPIRLVEMERKFMLLIQQDKMSVINKSLAQEVAESCGLSYTDQELVNMLNYFHQKGILLHFHKVPALSNMIILSPKWLAKLLTYILTTLKCQPVGPPLALFVRKLQTTGLLEEGLLEWSLQQFIQDEAIKGHKMVKLFGSDVADLLINFKLMADVSNTSLAGQNPRIPGKRLFLVPHLLPKEELVHSKAFCYHFFYYFPAKFILEHLVDQLIVKCAEWNRSKQYDILKLSYQWVCLELGKHQVYELHAMFDHSVIAIKIVQEPNLLPEIKEKAFADSNELVRSVQMFINDLMKEHMTATFAKAPVVCYIPCSQCKKMHLDVEKATEKNKIYCPISHVYADITDYHNILSAGLPREGTTSDDSTCNASDDSSRNTEVPTVTVSNLLQQKPKMRHLNNMVIPKIAAYWKKVADALEFEVWKIKTIEKKCRSDPEDCCDELLREWLSSGLGLHPKTWSTLINALKEVKQLMAITETIETDIQTTIT